MSFRDIIDSFDENRFWKKIKEASRADVDTVLKKDVIELDDLIVLLSDNSTDYLQNIAGRAKDITIQRFGNVINFYVPIYISNECTNHCTYCGFNKDKEIDRITLSLEEIEEEYKKIKEKGFDNVLILTGEAPNKAGDDFIAEAVEIAKKYFRFVGLEIYPMDTEGYKHLESSGADGLTIYQETYDKDIYSLMHLKGKKKDYYWRLDTPERAANAGLRKIGLGALLGLGDWRYEAFMLALHINYLQRKCWRSEYTLGFPRIRPFNNDFKIPSQVSDRDLVHMMSALRIFLPDVGFLFTTRESKDLRDNLIGLCITQISAGSKTNPKGYTNNEYGEQFSVCDERTLSEMMDIVKQKGYEPVLKDWEYSFNGLG